MFFHVKEPNLQRFFYNLSDTTLRHPNLVSDEKRKVVVPQDVIPLLTVDITQQGDYYCYGIRPARLCDFPDLYVRIEINVEREIVNPLFYRSSCHS